MEEVIKEYEEIKKMDDETLVKTFEELVRKGAGPEYLMVKWMRKEILKRLEKIKTIKSTVDIMEKILVT